MANTIALRPSYWASVSGGKDSLYMLKLILEHPDEYPLNGVVHFELEIDYPFIKDVIDYMESECKKFGIPFVRIKPRRSWWDLYEQYGFMGRTKRWCNSSYKMDGEYQLKAFLRRQGAKLVSYIGFCADEQRRFREELHERGQDITQIYPLAEHGIIEHDILLWARTVPLFNDFYKFNDRCGCMWCPLQSMQNSAYLLKYYPEKYEEMIRLARKSEIDVSKKLGRPYTVFHGDNKYTAEYRDKMVRNKYLPELEEKIQLYETLKQIDPNYK